MRVLSSRVKPFGFQAALVSEGENMPRIIFGFTIGKVETAFSFRSEPHARWTLALGWNMPEGTRPQVILEGK